MNKKQMILIGVLAVFVVLLIVAGNLYPAFHEPADYFEYYYDQTADTGYEQPAQTVTEPNGGQSSIAEEPEPGETVEEEAGDVPGGEEVAEEANPEEEQAPSESAQQVNMQPVAEASVPEVPDLDPAEIVTPESEPAVTVPDIQAPVYTFRNQNLLNDHYIKHGVEMGFASAEAYQAAASAVITNPNSLFKIEAEDGDGVYYLEATNEFVVLSTDGYIRTYFLPSAGKAYFDRQ